MVALKVRAVAHNGEDVSTSMQNLELLCTEGWSGRQGRCAMEVVTSKGLMHWNTVKADAWRHGKAVAVDSFVVPAAK